MTKQEIIDYVTTTPQNTNRRILAQQLDSLDGGGSGGLHVTISYDQGAGVHSASHTVEEIYEAVKTGPVTGVYISDGSESRKMLTLSSVRVSSYDSDNNSATFFCPAVGRNSTDFTCCEAYVIDADGDVTQKYLYTTAE